MTTDDRSINEPEKLPSGATAKLVGLGAVSLLWVTGGLAYGWHLGPPTAANEWGDLIAGVFAPAAFLWLIGAVWIQSDELREQRKELILTRKEFAYNREVMKAQAQEARNQGEMISVQTKLLLQAEGEREFAAKVAHLSTRFRLYGHIWRFESSHGRLTLGEVSPDASDDLTIVLQIAKAVRTRRMHYAEANVFIEGAELKAIYPLDWDETLTALQSCLATQEKLKGSALAKAEAYPLQTLLEEMTRISGAASNLQGLQSATKN